MKKLNIIGSFKEKKFRYGGYATLTTAVVLAILIVINLLVGNLNLKVDMTKNQLYSLSDQTYKVLEGLNKNVTIYSFFESGKEDPTITTILSKYTSKSKKITVQYVDPVKYPQFAQKYSTGGSTISEGSIVVESGSKFKVVASSDLVNYGYDPSGQPVPQSLAVEQNVTGAIMYVTSDKNPVVYTLTGHGEDTLAPDITKQLGIENYTIKDINLLSKDAVLEAGSTLVADGPQKDLSSDEAAKIKDFLSKSGRAIFLMNYTQNDMPNFQSVLNSYGVGIKRVIVVEGNPSYSANNPIYLLPQMGSHEIVNSLSASRIPVVIPGAQALDILNVKKSTTTIVPLLTTTDNSWGKVNPQATTAAKEKGDVSGPFNIALAVTDASPDNDTNKDTRLVVVSNALFANSQFAPNGGNIDFFMNSISWLGNQTQNISIRPKSLDTGSITINAMQQLVFSGLVVILIPLLIVLLGIRVILRRRRQ